MAYFDTLDGLWFPVNALQPGCLSRKQRPFLLHTTDDPHQ